MSYPICFVSLGPGDPELITLKGLKKLRQAEIIYCPATMNKNGQLLSRAARIIEELGIGNITTYTARHSYATVLKRSGVNISYISESLGHTD